MFRPSRFASKFDPFGEVLLAESTPFVVQEMARGADTVATRFIRQHHYARGCAVQQQGVYGLFDGPALPDASNLLGVLMLQVPCSEAVRCAVFGEAMKNSVTELHRLFIVDGTPHNTESWFIAAAFRRHRQLRPEHKAVLSFSDPSAGHAGIIYQATNARAAGKSTSRGKMVFREPETGRLRHPRQCGVNISAAEARARGWEVLRAGTKWRYLFLQPQDRREERTLQDRVILSAEVTTGERLGEGAGRAGAKQILRGWSELGQIAYPKPMTMNGNPTFRAGCGGG